MSNLQCSWGQTVVWNAKTSGQCARSNNRQPCVDLDCQYWITNQVQPACWNAAPPEVKQELGSQSKMINSANFGWSCTK